MRCVNIFGCRVFLVSQAFLVSSDPLYANRPVHAAGSVPCPSGMPTFCGSDIPDGPFPRVLPPANCVCGLQVRLLSAESTWVFIRSDDL